MAVYIDGKKKANTIFANVNGEKKSISSVWINKDGIPAKVFQRNERANDIGWNYTLDNQNNTIILNYYTGSETNVIVRNSYTINGRKYKTQIISNINKNGYGKYMFNCTSETVTSIDNIKSITFESGLDTSNITSMNYMFAGCEQITTLDLSNLNTSNVVSMRGMFKGCGSALISSRINLDNFDTSNVTDMNYMFSNCGFEALDLSNFNTSNVTDMRGMFYNLNSENLNILDLSSFKTYKVVNMANMFKDSIYLQKIYVNSNNWSTGRADKTMMFDTCGASSVTYK